MHVHISVFMNQQVRFLPVHGHKLFAQIVTIVNLQDHKSIRNQKYKKGPNVDFVSSSHNTVF